MSFIWTILLCQIINLQQNEALPVHHNHEEPSIFESNFDNIFIRKINPKTDFMYMTFFLHDRQAAANFAKREWKRLVVKYDLMQRQARRQQRRELKKLKNNLKNKSEKSVTI